MAKIAIHRLIGWSVALVWLRLMTNVALQEQASRLARLANPLVRDNVLSLMSLTYGQ